jgi:hypothetical protein
MREEMVLCFPRTLLDEIGSFQGVRTDVAAYVPRILEAGNTFFVRRAEAEQDPSRKQIIPYVLIRKGDTYLHYVRGKGSGEKRLVAMGSIGIGGHINHGDESLFLTGLDFYEEALQRELHEELRRRPGPLRHRPPLRARRGERVEGRSVHHRPEVPDAARAARAARPDGDVVAVVSQAADGVVGSRQWTVDSGQWITGDTLPTAYAYWQLAGNCQLATAYFFSPRKCSVRYRVNSE